MQPLSYLLLSLVLSSVSDEANVFDLRGPEVTKLDWETRSLVAYDLDDDGLKDLAVLNNDRAKIDLLLQRAKGVESESSLQSVRVDRWDPVLEDSRFVKKSIVTGITMYDLAIGDLDGDGRADLVYTGQSDPLTIRYQKSPGDWSKTRMIEIEDPSPWIRTILICDVHDDGRQDLVVLGKEKINIFLQNEHGDLMGPETLAVAESNCFGLVEIDANGDGRLDIAYVARAKDPLRIRLSLPSGGFGPERPLRIETPAERIHPFTEGAGPPRSFAFIQSRTGLIQLMNLGKSDMTGKPSARQLAPKIFSPGVGKDSACYALGDFDADGHIDIAVGDGSGARVLVYFQETKGVLGHSEVFPSFSGIRSIAAGDLDGDGRAELVVVSPKEQALGVSRFVPPGRMSYPEPLPCAGKPLAVAVADLDGDEFDDVIVAHSEKRKRRVTVLYGGAENRPPFEIALEDLKTDPRAIRILDADGDGRLDIAVFALQAPMRILLQESPTEFRDLSRSDGFRKSLVDKLLARELTVCDVDKDGKTEMLVSGDGFVRALQIDEDGVIAVLDQYNARSSDARISASLAVDIDRDGKKELMLFDLKAREVQVLKTDEAGVYRFSQSAPISDIDLVGSDIVDLDGDGFEDMLLWGEDRFLWIPTHPAEFTAKSRLTYETDLKDVSLTDLASGDLNSDGKLDIVAIDAGKSHVLEVLTASSDTSLRRALFFPIFEADTHYRGRRGADHEPREALIEDVTGDGKADLILLVHDRLLVYPQG